MRACIYFPTVNYQQDEIQLAAGDSLVFYTDGVLETRSRKGEAFGLERIVQSLSAPGGDINGRLRSLQSQLEDFGRGEPQRDDVTIVGLEIS